MTARSAGGRAPAPGSLDAFPPARGVRPRQRTELLAPDATVNFAAQRREADLDDLFAALDRELIGLVSVKKKVEQIGALLLVDRARQRFGFSPSRPNLHMCFTGAPGTGKTTVARAMGGVLFIDEAYSLFRDDDSRDYGQECVDILVQVMENYRDRLVVIMAGCKARMEIFFESNPGLRSRLAHRLTAEPDRPWGKDDLMRLEPADVLPSLSAAPVGGATKP